MATARKAHHVLLIGATDLLANWALELANLSWFFFGLRFLSLVLNFECSNSLFCAVEGFFILFDLFVDRLEFFIEDIFLGSFQLNLSGCSMFLIELFE